MAQTKAGAAKAAATKRALVKNDPRRDERGLLPQERAFVLHYLGAGRRSALRAAQLAGYSPTNKSSASAYASTLIRKPHIVAEIERLTEERNARLQITADDVLLDLVKLKTDAELLGKSVQATRARLDVIKAIGDHVDVGAFRRQVGLSGPGGGPIETVDAAALARLSDEELDQLEHARAILDRATGETLALPDGGGDSGGEGTPEAGA